MTEAIYTAASGAVAYQRRLEVLSNNLANISTAGFKEDRTIFGTYFRGAQDIDQKGSQKPPALKELDGMSSYSTSASSPVVKSIQTDFSLGPLKDTGNSLDFALQGKGLFCVQTPQGVRYTRNGEFALNDKNVLVTHGGLPVLGKAGTITVDGKDVVVDEQGNISVDGRQVDAFRIVDFENPALLEKVGDTLFALKDPGVRPTRVETAKVIQGHIELSNVDAVRVMTEMVEVLRGYESYQKVIRNIDDVTSKIINEVGRFE
jgi:flagellar basal-body rod protein FlgF